MLDRLEKLAPYLAMLLLGYRKLTAVITAQGFEMALIDDRLYKTGALIGGTDPRRCWRVEAIGRNRVALRFADVARFLTLPEQGRLPGAAKNRR